MGILSFVFGAIVGGMIEMIIQHPWEDMVEKRFQQLLHTGLYKKLYFKTVDYELLKTRLIEAIDKYDFEYAKLLLKQLEWFIEEKTEEEKEEARKIAKADYDKDLHIIGDFKGKKTPQDYKEEDNKWIEKS